MILALSLSACGNLKYLLQAGGGQLALLNRARPIPEVLKDERTPTRVKQLLSQIPEMKKFGETRGLKPTQNYTEYVKLDRKAAVWVVSACEPLQFKSKEWSFSIAGTYPYLGWFDLDNAKNFANELKQEGLDVDLRGASAYSTLGWFRDSVLSTMIPEGDEALGDLVNVVIHESVHATLYIKNQAYFNESVASFVADHLTIEYLDKNSGPDSSPKKAYVEAVQRGARIEKAFHQAYLQLAQVYRSQKSPQEKLDQKSKILADLKNEFSFKREINNATLIQYKTYNTGKEDFDSLFKSCHSDWKKFLQVLGGLKTESFPKSQADEFQSVLASLASQC